MNSRFHLTIPYREASELGDLTLRPGDLTVRYGRDGLPLLPVRSSTQHYGSVHYGPKKAPSQYGRVERAVDGPDGLWLLLQLDSIDARRMLQEFAQHRYYARPMMDMEQHLSIIEVGPFPSWPAAQLRPYRTAPQIPMAALAPVPKEWLQQ